MNESDRERERERERVTILALLQSKEPIVCSLHLFEVCFEVFDCHTGTCLPTLPRRQCDKMPNFFHYLATCNSSNLPKIMTKLSKEVQNFAKQKINPKKYT